ncbi:hypothetical protein CC78DRAFT_569177 [Lojkania enalia]|uniref:Uncharacterized protein n=1 Tax=Lojkania enalia TaxID=147567 RepID=A0A9P4K714_9PLEO|nr:hypothetical protein CC78DRAFT_569177 [Didymosphaeria enalia]
MSERGIDGKVRATLCTKRKAITQLGIVAAVRDSNAAAEGLHMSKQERQEGKRLPIPVGLGEEAHDRRAPQWPSFSLKLMRSWTTGMERPRSAHFEHGTTTEVGDVSMPFDIGRLGVLEEPPATIPRYNVTCAKHPVPSRSLIGRVDYFPSSSSRRGGST